ncbi:hypothetical protein CIHG_05876 [Coccidioides immitis H538.4]|uniref:Uncharacterized protein n=3 Tax=Coccidioides immitis TaxID=5501 RepID=A0A0J8RA00_COCIT|nr:hypothetical protein CIRG_01938 [Coccidioides immitis RMSCC 2394]KMU81919.1 hypothetical protein CISG_09388 [Coccidioides immitis RMSCC 3703]KMU88108.1 hypothetical protein CIHG_05876 [Coccidioides immitis H538.4]
MPNSWFRTGEHGVVAGRDCWFLWGFQPTLAANPNRALKQIASEKFRCRPAASHEWQGVARGAWRSRMHWRMSQRLGENSDVRLNPEQQISSTTRDPTALSFFILSSVLLSDIPPVAWGLSRVF